MLRAALLRTGEGEENLLFVDVHHLVVDGVSWRVLVGDLEGLCAQQRAGREPRLAEPSTSFKRWAELLEQRASELGEERVEEWTSEERERAGRLPLDLEGGENRAESTETVSVSLDEEETGRLLRELPGAYRTQVNEVLLTGLGRALGEGTGSERVLVEVEGHGREEVFEGVDLSRTVGWFTTQGPVLLEVGGEA